MLKLKQKETHLEQNNEMKIEKSKKGYFIEFLDTKMGPYKTIHFKNNLFYDKKTGKRGSISFPFSPKKYENTSSTEIFLLQKEIIIGTSQRKNIQGEIKKIVDIIHVNKKIKLRLEVESVSLIYNTKKDDAEILVINYEKNGKYETLEIDVNSLKIIQKINQKIQCNFNEIIIGDYKKYLHYVSNNSRKKGNIDLDGYFTPEQEMPINNYFVVYKYPMKEIVEYFIKNYITVYHYDNARHNLNASVGLGIVIESVYIILYLLAIPIKIFLNIPGNFLFFLCVFFLGGTYFYFKFYLSSSQRKLLQIYSQTDMLIDYQYLVIYYNPKIIQLLFLHKKHGNYKLNKCIRNFLAEEKKYVTQMRAYNMQEPLPYHHS